LRNAIAAHRAAHLGGGCTPIMVVTDCRAGTLQLASCHHLATKESSHVTSLRTIPSDQVSTTNLTRAEAAERSAAIQTQRFEVHLDLSGAGDHDTFTSTTTATFTSTPGASTWIDIIAPSIVSATLNGAAIDTSGFTGT